MAGILHQPESAAFLALAGPGFRDFTRIAASDPAVWRDVLTANREEVLRQCAHFRAALSSLEHLLQAGDGETLRGVVDEVSRARSGWSLGTAK